MSQTQPLVSIIIPTFNRAKFIGFTLKSVIEQTYKNFEILLVDDGSHDNTKEVIARFQDERLHYYFQENRGRSAARNLALQHAKGVYITFLDSDDVYYPDKIEKQVVYLENNFKFSMVYTSALCINDEGKLLDFRYTAKHSGSIYKRIAYFVPTTITLPTVMVRKEVFTQVGYFDQNMSRFEDTDMWRRISKQYKIYAMPDVTCLLRTHTENHLKNQDPEEIIRNIEYYSRKILHEDNQYNSFHQVGLGLLFQYYINAFFSVTEFHPYGEKLILLKTRILNMKTKGLSVIKNKILNALEETGRRFKIKVNKLFKR